MKKILSLLLIIVTVLGFSGCDMYKGKERVVGVTYENEIFNAVQNQECLSGLKLMQSVFRVAYFENLDPNEFENNLRTIINENHELIWCIEPKAKDILFKLAPEANEDQLFGLIDDTYENIPENITTITFREHEGAFLAGYIAGKVTEVNKVGFLAGEHHKVSEKYEYGYRAGIHYASKELQKPIEVVCEYTNDDHSKPLGKQAATKLYNEYGCDVIFQATQVTGLGAIEAAVELDKKIIGNGVDQSSYGPRNVITSVIKNAKNAINRVSTLYTEKEQIGGKNFDYGLKERVIGLAKTVTNLDSEVYKDAIDVRSNIIKGAITVPHNEETFNQYVAN